MNVYDVDNPESTGYLMNWTLTLFGEQDSAFKGTPIHTSTSIHQDAQHEIPVSSSSSSTTTKAVTTSSDNTPSRPTRIKSTTTPASSTTTTSTTSQTTTTSKITTTTSSTEESKATAHNDALTSEEEQLESSDSDDHSYLTIVYSVVGSFAILGVATALYFYKRNGWKPVSAPNRPNGYEFDVIQPLTELDENELSESDSDAEEIDRLVRNPH